jgi:CRISPR system Cascade subunit CasE
VPYLSRIFLNPNRHQARRLIGDPQAMHAAVLGGLPSQPVKERVLWRTDVHDPHRPGLLVLTQSRPSWEHMTEQAGWPSADDPADPQVLVRDYQPLLDRIAPDQEYAFRLTANPVKSTKRPEALTASQKERAVDGALQRSARLGHRTVASQTAWLISRAQRSGFEVPPAASSGAVGEDVPALSVIGRTRWSFNKPGGDARVVLQVVTYEGRLRVVDAEALRYAMLCGVGPAKAYGCGLLTLAPLSKDQRR